jgi:hypothetical protein
MTAQILASELTNLIQESKRKHIDLRNVSLRVSPFWPLLTSYEAAEKSMEELKGLRSTSEAQIAAGRVLYICGKHVANLSRS